MQTTAVTEQASPPVETNNQPEPNQTNTTMQTSDTGVSKPTELKIMKKRGGPRPNSGRPRKPFDPNKIINTREAPSRALILPTPPKQWFTKPEEFFTYWRSIKDPDLAGRIKVYVYRDWPVCDFRKFDVPGGKKSSINVDTIEGPCPDLIEPSHWKDGILKMWGSGDYRMMFNELATNRAQCVNITARDNVNFPPILDLRYLCENDPANKDFVRWARSTGRLQNEMEQREDEDMAANAESTLALTDTIKDLTRELIDNNSRPQPQAPPPPMSENSRAAVTGMEMLKDTMTTALGMVKNLANERTAVAASNPLDDATRLIEIAKSLAPQPAPLDNSMQMMLQSLLDQANKRTDRLEAIIEGLRAGPQAQVQATAPKSLLDQIAELKGIKETIGDLFGGGSENRTRNGTGDDDEGSGKLSTFDSIIKILPKVMEAGVVISGNAAQMMRSAAPTTPRPQAVTYTQTPQGGYTPNPGLPPGMQPKPDAQAIQQPMQVAVDNTTSTPAPLDPTLTPYFAFLDQIKPAFLHHLKEQLGGDMFADWLVNSREDGKLIYAQITDAGMDNLIELLRQYPPIWDVASMIPQRFSKFMDDFMDYGKDDPDDEQEPNNPAA